MSTILPTLSSERVTLRPLCEGDIPAFFTLNSDPEVTRYLSHPPYTELSQAEEKIKKHREGVSKGEYFVWAIEYKQNQVFLGTVSIFYLDRENQHAELGYILARDYWGMGLASESVCLAIDYFFSTGDFRRLEADIDPRNTKSARLLEGLGFVREGYLRERWMVAGEVSDTALYGLLKSEWRGSK